VAVIDLTLFSEDFTALEIRLNELWSSVDLFLICESNFSFSGIRKPLYLSENIDRFSSFQDRIRIVKFEVEEPKSNPWAQEAWQRLFLSEALHGLKPSKRDLIISSDCDEIPRASIIQKLSELSETDDVNSLLVLRNFTSFLNVSTGFYRRGRVVSYKSFKSAQQLRQDIYVFDNWSVRRSRLPIMRIPVYFRNRPSNFLPELAFRKPKLSVLSDAGWHFNHLMRDSSLSRKVSFSSHTELVGNTPQEDIVRAINEGKDLYGLQTTELVEIDDSYPSFVKENIVHFERFIYKNN
jgi:beta-1,4-mannosyl-glycoprotein beta-1,4-N-acetylglucosaminyltransferase